MSINLKHGGTRSRRNCLLAIAFILGLLQPVAGYSVLTHEALIDATWDGSIKPLLLERYPQTTPDQLRDARAYAYGGAIIQDLGYYPFGSKLFSNLAHYVRSGDFVVALVSGAQDVNELAFALGALEHYAADGRGHPLGVNKAEPLIYPSVRKQFGSDVTYEEDPVAHVRTEFAFDVLETAKGRYAPSAYHDFIGFKVSKPLLERAFRQSYGIELKEVLSNEDLSIGTYRRTVSTLIPEMTKVAWETRKDDIGKLTPGITRDKFIYSLSHADYRKQWGDTYSRPGVFARVLAFAIKLLPKVGPLKVLRFRAPTPEAEEMFLKSADAALTEYQRLIVAARNGDLHLENANLDTGQVTLPGKYRLTDETYAHLLHYLAKDHFANLTSPIRENILSYYGNLNAPFETRMHKKEWRRTLSELDQLRQATPVGS